MIVFLLYILYYIAFIFTLILYVPIDNVEYCGSKRCIKCIMETILIGITGVKYRLYILGRRHDGQRFKSSCGGQGIFGDGIAS